jgi:DNA-binding MarR family transcriptional regulator
LTGGRHGRGGSQVAFVGTSNGFEGDRKRAWEASLRAYARILHRLAADLEEARKVSIGTYDVLVQLAEHGGTLRLKDLVDQVVLSQPGLSRKVARLEEEGLVQRRPDPSDGRGVLVKITRSGRAALRNASVVHVAGIEREFTSRITDAEAEVLVQVYERLLAPPPVNGGVSRRARSGRSAG